MALKDIWKDLQNTTNGIDGDDITAEPINNIAQAVIALEKALKELSDAGISVDLSNYYTKYETNNEIEKRIAVFDYADKYYVANEINLALQRYYNKTEIDAMIGDIGEVTTAIIELQNNYIGGETV